MRSSHLRRSGVDHTALPANTPHLPSPLNCSPEAATAVCSTSGHLIGWVGLVSWPTADGLPTVTHQLRVKHKPGEVHRSETGVLPLSYATNLFVDKDCVTICQFIHITHFYWSLEFIAVLVFYIVSWQWSSIVILATSRPRDIAMASSVRMSVCNNFAVCTITQKYWSAPNFLWTLLGLFASMSSHLSSVAVAEVLHVIRAVWALLLE